MTADSCRFGAYIAFCTYIAFAPRLFLVGCAAVDRVGLVIRVYHYLLYLRISRVYHDIPDRADRNYQRQRYAERQEQTHEHVVCKHDDSCTEQGGDVALCADDGEYQGVFEQLEYAQLKGDEHRVQIRAHHEIKRREHDISPHDESRHIRAAVQICEGDVICEQRGEGAVDDAEHERLTQIALYDVFDVREKEYRLASEQISEQIGRRGRYRAERKHEQQREQHHYGGRRRRYRERSLHAVNTVQRRECGRALSVQKRAVQHGEQR